jgi:hypothetical protein
MEAFKQLGDDIQQRWLARNCSRDSFPEIAVQALAEHDVPARVRHLDVASWALRAPLLPPQSGSRFGQPPLNVYVGRTFYIEVLTWVESTTSIHQHGFGGAFQVLEGSSVHSRYGFEQHERIDNRLLVGDTRFQSSELLTRGSIRPILAGNGLIHALFHLEHPSATIVVRTFDDATGPQYNYEKPHLAVDPFYAYEPFNTQTALLRMLSSIKSPQLDAAFADVIANSDAWTAYHVLDLANKLIEDAARIEDLVAAARRRHGALADVMADCLAEAKRQANIVLRRGRIQNPEHRFLLALLLNVPAREPLLAMVAQRYPAHDPIDWIVARMGELAQDDQIGLTLDAVSLSVLGALLRGQELPGVKSMLAARYGSREVERKDSALAALIAEMRAALLFKPLFA